MKKLQFILLGIVILFVLYLIFNKEEYITCNKKSMNKEYTLLSNYKIYYKNKEVYKIEIEENVEAKTANILNQIMQNIENSYKSYKEEIGSYDYEITKEKTKGKTNVIINYDEIDMEAYLKYNPDANLNENKRYNIDDLKKLYEEGGATCK